MITPVYVLSELTLVHAKSLTVCNVVSGVCFFLSGKVLCYPIG